MDLPRRRHDEKKDARQESPRLEWSALAAPTAVAVLVALPVFMVGTLAVEIRGDVSFSNVALGGLVSIFSGLAALAAFPAGRVVERIGYRFGLVLAFFLAGVALLGPALLAHQWWHLAAGQAVAAGGAALAIPSVQVALVTRIPPERQGVAFGLNMSALPAAILLAGIAVPLVGETVGWRWAFGGAGAVGIGLSFAAATSLRNERWTSLPGARVPIQRKLVFLGSGAMFLGIWGVQTVATFAVESGVDAGHSAGSIGYALAVASVVSIAVRIVAGWWADRTGPVRAFLMIPALIVIGGVGIGLLAVGGSFLVVAAGLVLGLGFGWSWHGVLVYGLVRPNPRAVATTASFVMIGGFSGSALGPIVSGALVSGPGFGAAWTVAALAMVGAAVMTTLAGRDHRLGEVA